MSHAPGGQFADPVDAIIVGPITVGAVEIKDEVTTDEARVLPDGTALLIGDANGLLVGIYDAVGGVLRVRQGTPSGSAFSTLQNAGGLTITSTTFGPVEALDVNVIGGAGGGPVSGITLVVGASVAPLGGGGTFVAGGAGGVATDGFDRVAVSVFADVAGSFDIEVSVDAGVTFDKSGATVVVGGGALVETVRFLTAGEFIRVTYTNGVGAQAAFRFRAIIRTIG